MLRNGPFFDGALAKKLLRPRLEQGLDAPTTDEEQEEFKGEKLAALSKFGFIPGVIVQGNG